MLSFIFQSPGFKIEDFQINCKSLYTNTNTKHLRDIATHHEKDDGEQQLHKCQPCFQIRHLLVHHSFGNRRIGAISCPHLMNSCDQASPPVLQSASIPSRHTSSSSHLLQSRTRPGPEPCAACFSANNAAVPVCAAQLQSGPASSCGCPSPLKLCVISYNFTDIVYISNLDLVRTVTRPP